MYEETFFKLTTDGSTDRLGGDVGLPIWNGSR